MVIGDRPLDELVPLYRDPRSDMPATQFNMKWVEPAGLVKFDFLGLKTLTVLDRALELCSKARGVDLDLAQSAARRPEDLRAADPRRHGRRVPAGRRRHARHAAQAEARPVRGHHRAGRALPAGADGQHPALHRRASTGRKQPDYLHPQLEGILKETYGIMIYQEQVMQIAQVLAGYTLGGADSAPRHGQEDQGGDGRPAGAVRRRRRSNAGSTSAAAELIFDQVAKFAGYGFNKSPRRRLCAGRLPDRLSEGELSRSSSSPPR